MADQVPESFAPTVDLVPIRAVLTEERPGDGALIVMKDGSFRFLMRSGAVNFDMKSPPERAAITYAFGALVNSLEVESPIEIVSHSKRLDVDAYARQYEARLASERTPPAIRRLIQAHVEHFENHVKQNNLLQREFYIVLPWKGTSGPLQKSFTDDIPLAPLFKRLSQSVAKNASQYEPTDQEIAVARQQLDLRAEGLEGRLGQMGIWSERMGEEEIRELLYELYNPSLAERQSAPEGDYEGRLMQGFSIDTRVAQPRSLVDDQPLGPPKFT